MSGQDQEQNRSEEATPFKLRRAREKGMVARGLDLGFFGGLVALAAFVAVAGATLMSRLAETMQRAFAMAASSRADPQITMRAIGDSYWPALQSVMLMGGTVLAIVLLLEIVQLRGIFFTTHPLKPDFSRINPAKGLKRIFSLRMLKEAFKNVLKLTAYALVTLLVLRAAMAAPGRTRTDAAGVADGLYAFGMRLLLLFILLALFFAALDQLLVRREYAKQMRMSRRELTRESKEREGEPRLKQRRKQLHAEFATQAEGFGRLAGSDMLIVNPEHVAIALAYEPEKMSAPTVRAKGRDRHALAMRQRAFVLGIPVFENRPLARQLYRDCAPGTEIGAAHFRAVADLYLKLRLDGSKGGSHDAQ
ncbi:MAG: EscU/YscU/HrcU family type III secretion system export apparatus switch protein [Pseudomonadota bacterium]|nr:EscU/YscU/HrcU family type III secretion system export apparatus switch protein [Pseudomonadota bacterium]